MAHGGVQQQAPSGRVEFAQYVVEHQYGKARARAQVLAMGHQQRQHRGSLLALASHAPQVHHAVIAALPHQQIVAVRAGQRLGRGHLAVARLLHALGQGRLEVVIRDIRQRGW